MARLRATLDEQRRNLGQAEAFIGADMKFHTQIAGISGNPIYVAVSEAMLGWLKEYHTEMLIWTGKEKYTLAEHEEIIGRIAAHDPEGAEKAMIKHLERSRALYALECRQQFLISRSARPHRRRGESRLRGSTVRNPSAACTDLLSRIDTRASARPAGPDDATITVVGRQVGEPAAQACRRAERAASAATRSSALDFACT